MKVLYGSTDNKNIHTDTSKTLLGAKQYATRNDLKNVSMRVGYNVELIEFKKGGKWYTYKEAFEFLK
tara:strand:- start:1001 stop:1201 length:201 start_codon:yes stop_codon:yes gene_type:complete